MDLTETSKTPVTDSNTETIMVPENVKKCCCSNNNEKKEADCCKRSPAECCITQRNIKMEDPVAKTCLERPRKCVDICQHGCCVTIRCDGERKIICLRTICSGKVTCSKTCGEPFSGEDLKNRCDESKNCSSITSNSKTEDSESGPVGDGETSCKNSKKCFKSIGSRSEDDNAKMMKENVNPDCEDTKCSCCNVGSTSGKIDFDKCCTREKASSSFDDDVAKNTICKNRSAADGKTGCCNTNQHVGDESSIKGWNCPTACRSENNRCCCDKITGCRPVSLNVGCCIVIIQTRSERCNCVKPCTQTSGQIKKSCCCSSNSSSEKGCTCQKGSCPASASGEDVSKKTVGVPTQDSLCCGDGCMSAKETKLCKLEVQCCCTKEQGCCNTIQTAQDASQMKMCYCQTACSDDIKILCSCYDRNEFCCCQCKEPCNRTSNNIETASQTRKMCCCIVTNIKKCTDTCTLSCCKIVIKCWCERSEGCDRCSCSRNAGAVCGKNFCCTSTSEDITRKEVTPQELLCSGKCCEAECSKLEG